MLSFDFISSAHTPTSYSRMQRMCVLAYVVARWSCQQSLWIFCNVSLAGYLVASKSPTGRGPLVDAAFQC